MCIFNLYNDDTTLDFKNSSNVLSVNFDPSLRDELWAPTYGTMKDTICHCK